jgi:transcriptional regulator with PAS, ATPase and Fis domain
LLEPTLFGYAKGAFTGAITAKSGYFEDADSGTLFLDEIGELPLAAQAKLLRVLQEGEIERLGDERTRKVNVRLVAATNVNLQEAVAAGQFRRDLFYRLNIYPITIPPLRDRVADIPPLIDAMLTRFCSLHDKRVAGLTDKAMRALKVHPWPGNVRELENVIERGVILAPHNGWIEAEHLFVGPVPQESAHSSFTKEGVLEESSQAASADRLDLPDAVLDAGISLDTLEQELLQRAVKRAKGNLSAAARLLGITRPQLNYRLKKNA